MTAEEREDLARRTQELLLDFVRQHESCLAVDVISEVERGQVNLSDATVRGALWSLVSEERLRLGNDGRLHAA